MAAPHTREHRIRYGRAFLGHAQADAPWAFGPAAYPWVLLVHGLKGTPIDLSWMGEGLARAGMVAVAVELAGSSYRTFDAALAPQVWRRAEQLRHALDVAARWPLLRERVDVQQVALAAHSAGASAALVAAGAAVHEGQFLRRYPGCGPVAPPVPADGRIGAIVALAPGTGEVFDAAGLRSVAAPLLLVSGGRDLACPDRFNSAVYAQHVPSAEWMRLPWAGHYTFKPCCSWYGKVRAPALCWDHWRLRRAAVHAQILTRVRAFLSEASHAQGRKEDRAKR